MSRPLRVLLGVSGGIAAYKSAELVRRLRGRGHEVRCALTRSAVSFVAPLTLEVLSGRPVHQEEYLVPSVSPGVGGEEEHIAAASWAEVLCVAPATTHVLARLALGLADDFLTTTALAFTGPLVVAPGHALQHVGEALHPTARRDSAGARSLARRSGGRASGLRGGGDGADGRAGGDRGRGGGGRRRGPARRPARVLVTAGPTHEPLDPVRFLGNRSSGKMGFALAAEAARRGARVVLVAGPVSLPTPSGVIRVDVVTAREMESAVHEHAPAADLVVMAAAVADFRPRRVAPGKIKKEEGLPALELEENPDILAGLRAVAPRAVLVGFAAETGDLERHARAKLERKGADFLVANDVSRRDIAFESGDNEVTVFRRQGDPLFFSRRPKPELAASLFDLFTATLLRP